MTLAIRLVFGIASDTAIFFHKTLVLIWLYFVLVLLTTLTICLEFWVVHPNPKFNLPCQQRIFRRVIAPRSPWTLERCLSLDELQS